MDTPTPTSSMRRVSGFVALILLVGSGGPHSEDVLARHLGLLTRMLRALRGTA